MSKAADIIVLGLSPTGLYAVREAARAGLTVWGVGAPGAAGLWSRYLSKKGVANTPAARVELILKMVDKKNADKPVLIVTSDQDLEAVIESAEKLAGYVHLQGSYTDGLAQQIMDKDTFYRLCESQDVAYPALRSVSRGNIQDVRAEIAFPSMIKPARIQDVKHLMSGKKGWIVRNSAEFDNVESKIPAEAGTLLVQEIVPGDESNITLWCGYFGGDGALQQSFTARKLRQFPPGFGSASLVQSETCLETAKIAENFLSAMGYRGIAAAEFKRHPDTGELKIIEVNPRPSLWFSISSASGVALIETAFSDLKNGNAPPKSEQKNGVLWRYASKDLASKLFYIWKKDFVLPPPDMTKKGPVTGHADVTFALDDPAPTLAEIVHFGGKVFKRLASRIGIWQ